MVAVVGTAGTIVGWYGCLTPTRVAGGGMLLIVVSFYGARVDAGWEAIHPGVALQVMDEIRQQVAYAARVIHLGGTTQQAGAKAQAQQGQGGGCDIAHRDHWACHLRALLPHLYSPGPPPAGQHFPRGMRCPTLKLTVLPAEQGDVLWLKASRPA
jgi:hypothetical protein